MIYVQFLDEKLDGTIGEALGSDSIYQLDGRNNLDNMINDVYERIQRLSRVRNYKHFEIRRGNLRNYQTIYKSPQVNLQG